jgi:hypothetical protein
MKTLLVFSNPFLLSSSLCRGCVGAPSQLVLINLSDHYTRTKANAGASSNGASTSGASATTKVMGILLGSQVGRTVDISNSFEIKFQPDPTTGAPVIDIPFLTHRQEQCELADTVWGLYRLTSMPCQGVCPYLSCSLPASQFQAPVQVTCPGHVGRVSAWL